VVGDGGRRQVTPGAISAEAEPLIDPLTEWLIRYRWLFVVPILLPLSALFDLFWSIRDLYIHRVRGSPAGHEARVGWIQEQIRRRRAAGIGQPLCTARRPWLSISPRLVGYKRPENSIEIELHDILAVDTARGVVVVEPQVTIGQLIRRLLPMGWTLGVVPELDDLTAGGLFVGYGVETSSHKHGLFAELVESCDVVLGDGSLVRASSQENADLFRALPWSMGALGFVVKLTLRIVPAKPYIRVSYRAVRGRGELCRIFAHESCRDDAADAVEALVFGPEEAVVITGVFANAADGQRINRVGRWYKPWFAAYCRRALASPIDDECIPLSDYYRRHRRGMFWECALIVPFGNQAWFRWLFGWMMPPKIAFLKLTQGKRIKRYYDEKHVVQDALVPMSCLDEALAYFDEIFDAYPVWLCPMRVTRTDPPGAIGPKAGQSDEMYVDIGAFLVPGPVARGEDYSALAATRQMEKFLLARRGYQALYAVTQLARDEFSAMFDRQLYDRVRRDYGATGVLMDVYDKVKPAPY
jgi:Delta24-sterol reductase